MIHSQKVQAISLFSGAGGLDIGCKKSGVEVKIAIDNDPDSVETLKLNQTSLKTKILNENLKEYNPNKMEEYSNYFLCIPSHLFSRIELKLRSVKNFIGNIGRGFKVWLSRMLSKMAELVFRIAVVLLNLSILQVKTFKNSRQVSFVIRKSINAHYNSYKIILIVMN